MALRSALTAGSNGSTRRVVALRSAPTPNQQSLEVIGRAREPTRPGTLRPDHHPTRHWPPRFFSPSLPLRGSVVEASPCGRLASDMRNVSSCRFELFSLCIVHWANASARSCARAETNPHKGPKHGLWPCRTARYGAHGQGSDEPVAELGQADEPCKVLPVNAWERPHR